MMSAPGKTSCTRAHSLGETGAEPMRTMETDDRSSVSNKSSSMKDMASMVGTEVIQVHLKRSMASRYLRALNSGRSTVEVEAR